MSSFYAVLVFSACFVQGYSLPQNRISSEEFGRKFGSTPKEGEVSNSIDDTKPAVSPAAKEEKGLMQSVIEIGLKILPVIIDTLSGSTGPSQTDRIEGIDLNGEDPFSMRNILFMGLKLFLAIAGGSPSNIEKADSSPMQVVSQGVMEAVIGALTGSGDKAEVQVMAKQATEVINLVMTLVEALTTSMSQRSFF